MDQREYHGIKDANWSNEHENHCDNKGATSHHHSNEHRKHTYSGMQHKHGNKKPNKKHHVNVTERYAGIKLNNCEDNKALDVIMNELYLIRMELRDVRLDIQELKARKNHAPRISVH